MPEAVTDTVLAGRYRLVRPLARGGMAEVWEAHDTVLDRPVAVKMLHAHLASDATFIERFRREAVAAARLSHRNVIATYDTGNDQGRAFIVMELARGHTLAAELAAHRPLAPAVAVRIAAEVADALDYAHRAGVVHRDVKPGNILLFDDGRVKVSDFGIAKAAATTDLTQTGTMLGTTRYVSPEQVEAHAVDGRSDVYSLGVVLYEMLCGRPPFTGDSDIATALMHVRDRPTPPRQLRAGIPKPLEALVTRAMAKSPADRYPSAGAFRDALLAIAGRGLDAGVPRGRTATDDDATALVVRDPTPPSGSRAIAVAPGRRWPPVAVLLAVLLVAAGVVLYAVTGTNRTPQRGATATAAVTISGLSTFDPAGGDGEHDELLGNLDDGHPDTTWHTHTYTTPEFGGLKPGVGVILNLDHRTTLRRLTITSTSSGWSGQVFVASQAEPTLAAWGAAVGSFQAAGGTTTVDLRGAAGRAVLLWITRLAPADNTVSIGELALGA